MGQKRENESNRASPRELLGTEGWGGEPRTWEMRKAGGVLGGGSSARAAACRWGGDTGTVRASTLQDTHGSQDSPGRSPG